MQKIKNFHQLAAWQEAHKLVLQIYKATNLFPKKEQFVLTSQILRAVISISSNIAEGYMRGTKEYVQFLKFALGSCAELETQVFISRELDYCVKPDFEDIDALVKEIMKLIISYIKKLEKKTRR